MTINKSLRSMNLAYLKSCWSAVIKIDENNEPKITPSEDCKIGEEVFILGEDDTFTRTKIIN